MSNHVTEAETLVQRWFNELFTNGDLSVADDILAEDVEYIGPTSLSPTEVHSPADVKEYVEVYQQAFPDLEYTVDAIYEAGDAVIARWTMTGTHESDLFGIESSGEEFTEYGINIFSLEEGRIQSVWSEWDTLKMVQELDIVPDIGLASQ